MSNAAGVDTRVIRRYDPGSGATQVVAQLPAPLSHATAVYLLGGFVNNIVSNQVLRVDLPSGAVSPAGTLPAGVTDAAAVVIGHTAYLVGGQGPNSAPVDTVLTLSVGR